MTTYFTSKNIEFTRFPVPFDFIFKFQNHKDVNVYQEEIDGRSVDTVLYKIALPFEIQKRLNHFYVYVRNFPNRNYQCWAGSSINDEEVINFILKI